MTEHPYVKRLQELAVYNLNCSLDDNEPGYIPPDLVPGTYRWYLYMYSNMFKVHDGQITIDDREMFIKISEKFISEHMISWTRDTLIAIKEDVALELKRYLGTVLRDTQSFSELKVALYVLRCIGDNFLVVDSYILNILPRIWYFVKK